MPSLSIVFAVLSVLLLGCCGQDFRYTTANDIPRFVDRLKLEGVVTSVHEGDTFMFYHLPGDNSPLPRPSSYRDALIVRLVGIHAPKMSRPGKPGEPLAEQARSELSKMILNRRVRLDVFGKDFNNQVWGSIYMDNDYVSLKMIDKGLAYVLKDRNAEYGDIRRALFRAESQAKNREVGVWKVKV